MGRFLIGLRIVVLALLVAFSSQDGTNAATGYPPCETTCSASASCTAECEQPVGEIWQLLTCGEYHNGWDGGYCEPPGDIYDTGTVNFYSTSVEIADGATLAPYVTGASSDVPANQTEETAFDNAVNALEAEFGANGGPDTIEEVEWALSTLYSYGVLNEDPAMQEAPQSLAVNSLSKTADLEAGVFSLSTFVRAILNHEQQSCSGKWWKIAKRGMWLAGIAAVGVAANSFAVAVPAAIPAVAKLDIVLYAGAAITGGQILLDVQEPCVAD